MGDIQREEFEQNKARRLEEINKQIDDIISKMSDEQLYSFGAEQEEIARLKLEANKILEETYSEPMPTKTEYQNLKTQMQEINKRIENQKKEYKENPLRIQAEQLKKEISKLKALGRNDSSEYREYMHDITKIEKELSEKYKGLKEDEQELSKINAKIQELKKSLGEEQVEITRKRPTKINRNNVSERPQNSYPERTMERKPFSYEVSAKGVYYDGELQDADELERYWLEHDLQDFLSYYIEPDQLEYLFYNCDPYLISAIIYNGAEGVERGEEGNIILSQEAIDRAKDYIELLQNPRNKEKSKLKIKYDLRDMDRFSRLTHRCILNKYMVHETMLQAKMNGNIAEVIPSRKEIFKAKIKNMFKRSKVKKIPEKTGLTIEETNGKQENGLDAAANFRKQQISNKFNNEYNAHDFGTKIPNIEKESLKDEIGR